MADAIIRFNVDGQAEAASAFDGVARAAKQAGQMFGESGDLFSSSWGKFSEILGPAEGAFNSLFQALGPVEVGIAGVVGVVAAAGVVMFELGEKATAAGAEIAKTALIMNENAAAVRDMQFAWKAAGGDLDKLNQLVFMFEQRTENSTDKMAKGFKELGLNLNDFANATTTDKILAISGAMRNAGDGTNVAAAAFDIFGRGAKNSMAELMGPLADMAQHSKEIGQTWSDVDAKAALDFERSLSALKTQADTTWTALGKDFAPISEAMVYGWDRMKLAVANVAYAIDQVVTGFGYFGAAWSTFISQHEADLPRVQSSTKGIIDADGQMFGLAAKGLKDYTDRAGGAADLAADLNAKMAGADKELREELKAAHEEQTRHAAEWKKTLEEMNKIEGGFASDSMNWTEKVGNNRRDAIDGWREHSSKAFEDVRRIEHEYTTDAMDWTKKLADTRDDGDIKFAAAESKVKSEAGRLWNEYYGLIESRSQTTAQRQISEVNRWYQNEVDKAHQAGIKDSEYYNALALLAKTKMDDVRLSHDLTFQAVSKMQNDLTTGWQQNFSDTLTKGDFSVTGFATAFEGIFATIKKDVEGIFSGMLTSIISGFLQPLLDNVKRVASSISGMLLNALTGHEPGEGGFGGFVSGGGSFTNPTSLLGGLLKGGLGGVFSGGGAVFSGIAASEAAGIAGATAAGLGVTAGGIATGGLVGGAATGTLASTTIGTGMIGAVGGTGSGAVGAAGTAGGGSLLGTVAGFLATNPIGWAIDAGIGALALWNHFSGPDDTELAGRAAVKQWEDDIWNGLSDAQRQEASGAGWSNPKDAGALVWMRTTYENADAHVQVAQKALQVKQALVASASNPQARTTAMAAADEAQRNLEDAIAAAYPKAETRAEAYMQNVWGSITKGPSAVVSAVQDVGSYDVGGMVRGPFNGAPVRATVHDGEIILNQAQQKNVAAGLSMDAVHAQLVGLRSDLKTFMRTQPIMLRHALRAW